MTMEQEIIEERLSNGARIVMEPIPSRRVVSMGFWVRAGSRDEPEGFEGCSHVMEHMAFKGTEKRTAEQISNSIEERGGYLNAFTDRDLTCYTARVLQEDAELAIDVLSDMIQAPLFLGEELKKEKQVVMEEICRREDNPEVIIEDLSNEAVWRGNPMAHPILGTRESIEEISISKLKEFHKDLYTPTNTIITAVGGLNPSRFTEALEKFLTEARTGTESTRRRPIFRKVRLFHERDSNQVHLCIVAEGLAHGDLKRPALSLLNSYLGVGASSRLFQEVREKRGLVYSIYTHDQSLGDCGLFRIFAGTSRSNVEQVLNITLGELERLCNGELTAVELEKAKGKMKGMLGLSFESSRARMYHLGVSTLRIGRPQPIAEIVEGIENVTLDEINELSAKIFHRDDLSFITIGLPPETSSSLEEIMA